MILNLGQANANAISKHTKVPRQAVYRTLQELLHKGLVEKVLTTPYEFRPTPIDMGLSILIKERIEDCRLLEKKAEEIFQRSKSSREISSKKEPRLLVIEGIEAINQLFKRKHNEAQNSADIITTVPRLIQILNYNLDNYKGGLERGVKYRVLVDQPENEDVFFRKLQILLTYPNFKLGIMSSDCGPVKVNMAVFDGKVSNFNFFPSKMLHESPVISTNHPSILAMFESHFEACWKKAKKK